jgi:hypothetical protein
VVLVCWCSAGLVVLVVLVLVVLVLLGLLVLLLPVLPVRQSAAAVTVPQCS